MFNLRMLIAIVAGVALFAGELLVLKLSGESLALAAGFGALAGATAGLLGLSSRGFFGGLIGALLCVLAPGLSGNDYDQFGSFLGAIILVPLTVIVPGFFFMVGKAMSPRNRSV